jgi:hypothetical protein
MFRVMLPPLMCAFCSLGCMTSPPVATTTLPAESAIEPSAALSPSWIEKLTPVASWRPPQFGQLAAFPALMSERMTSSMECVGDYIDSAARFSANFCGGMMPSNEWFESHETVGTILGVSFAVVLLAFEGFAHSAQ